MSIASRAQSPPPGSSSADELQLFTTVAAYADALDALPLDLTRSFSDLRELDAVLGTHLQSLTQRLTNLTSVVQDTRLSPGERLLALKECAEEARAYKMGGEDKIRVAVNTAETIISHASYITSLLDTLRAQPTIRAALAPQPSHRAGHLLDGTPVGQGGAGLSSAPKPKKNGPPRMARIAGASAAAASMAAQAGLSSLGGGGASGGGGAGGSNAPSPMAAAMKSSATPKKRKIDEVASTTSTSAGASTSTNKGASTSAPKKKAAPSNSAQHASAASASARPVRGAGTGTPAPTASTEEEDGSQQQQQASASSRARRAPPPPHAAQQQQKEEDFSSSSDNAPVGVHIGAAGAQGMRAPRVTRAVRGEGGEGEEDERRYCFCDNVSYGDMIGCDGDDCEREWFHLGCVGLQKPPQGTWYCDDCAHKRAARSKNKKPATSKAKAPLPPRTVARK